MAEVPDWMYRQSAVIPYRRSGDRLELLLVTSRKGRRWVLPKGVVDPGMTAAESAAKEALEEAGVRGPVDPRVLGIYRYRKWRGTCTVEVFAMAVEEELATWPEASRKREWLAPEEAQRRVDEAELKAIIGLCADQLGRDDGG
jgi:phosphohistidine phosphatase